MKIAIILGTRPEIIKLSPVIRECVSRKVDYFIIHTNQHYSAGMDKVFFDELKLPQAKYNLDVHNSDHGVMVGKMLIGIEPILKQENPDWVLVQGDTNTVMAGAIAASKLGIKVGHVEAGLRSYDRTMPEEINRIIIDHIADALFCPTNHSATLALGEGIPRDKVYMTGNTIVDAVKQNLSLAESSSIATKYENKQYLLLTMHRPSNVDTKDKLIQIINSLSELSATLNTVIIFPIHPRTASVIKRFGVVLDETKIKIIEPVGYLEMLLLMKGAKLIITDSGGVQEEACILKVPCITIRDNTERPETVEVGANIITGTTQYGILSGASKMLSKNRNWSNPFGDGKSAENIVDKVFLKT